MFAKDWTESPSPSEPTVAKSTADSEETSLTNAWAGLPSHPFSQNGSFPHRDPGPVPSRWASSGPPALGNVSGSQACLLSLSALNPSLSQSAPAVGECRLRQRQQRQMMQGQPHPQGARRSVRAVRVLTNNIWGEMRRLTLQEITESPPLGEWENALQK